MIGQAVPSRCWAMVCVVGGVALAARLIVLGTIAPARPAAWESEDVVNNVLAGRGFTYEQYRTVYRACKPPLYEALCVAVYRLTGHSQRAMVLLQCLFGALAAALAAWIAAQLFGAAAGWIAGAGVALHPALVYYDTHQLHALSLAALLTAAVIALLLRGCASGRPVRWAWLAGAAIGVLAHERGTALFLVPLGALWLCWARRARGMAAARLAVPVLLGFALVITPWTIRNYVVLNRWIFMTSTSGLLFWRGNNPHATGTAVDERLTPLLRVTDPAFQARLKSLDELGQRDFFMKEARAFIRTQPAAFAGLTARKFGYFWWFAPTSGYRYPPAYFAAYRWYYALLLALAFWGMIGLARRGVSHQREQLALLVGVMLVFSAAQAFYYVETRHRWVIEPLLIVCAAGPLAAFWRRWRGRRRAAGPSAASGPAPIRILRVITRMNIGGPAVHVGLLSTRLDPARFATTVVTGAPEPDEGDLSGSVEQGGARLVRLAGLRRPLRLFGDAAALVGLVRVAWAVRPHIIHTHTAKAGALGRAAGLLYNAIGPGRRRQDRAVLIHTFHGHVLEGYFSPATTRLFVRIERWLARRTDVLIAVSRAVREELLQLGIGRPEQWRVIPLGLDLAALSQLPLPNGGGDVRAGLIGRLVPIKNPALFLQALRGADGAQPVQGLVVGDGPLRARLEQEARRLGVADLVEFTGWRHDLRGVYGGIDIACLTSWNEGTPVALIEAMAAGRPVVATAVGGVPDLLEDDPARSAPLAAGEVRITPRGILVAPGDAAAMAAAVRRMASDVTLRRALGEAGRAFVTQRFDQDRLVRDITGLYERMEKERGL